MRRLFFRPIAITLILAHVFSFCLRDLALAREPAKVSTAAKSSGSTAASSAQPANSANSTNAAAKRSVSKASVTSALPAAQSAFGFNSTALQSLQNDPFSGRAVFSLPILVPQGRKGLQPSPALSYASGASNGILGVGWSLELGHLERSTKRGAPKYDDNLDSFVLVSNGSSQELVKVALNEYRPKIEGGFSKFIYDGTSWVVIDKSGTKFYFGSTQNSRQEKAAGKIYSWYLDKVIDRQANFLEVKYSLEQAQIYPAKISYTANEARGLPASNSIEFVLEEREDTFINCRSGFVVETAKRLKEIKIFADSRLVRKYGLAYDYSASTKRSILTSVTQQAGEAGVCLPPLNFSYSAKQPAFNPLFDWPLGQDYSGNDLMHCAKIRAAQNNWGSFVDNFDINADGQPDQVIYNSDLPYY
jgi:hypothetical protein